MNAIEVAVLGIVRHRNGLGNLGVRIIYTSFHFPYVFSMF